MFSFISWESFFTITAATVGIYYTTTSLAFYHKEFANWVKTFSAAAHVVEGQIKSSSSENMMGATQAIQQEHTFRSSVVVAEDLMTSGEDEEPEALPTTTPKDDLLIGTVADLLEEIKTLSHVIAGQRTIKSDSEALFNALFARYPHLQSTSYPLAISLYISEISRGQFPFDLTPDEVMSWWSLPKHQ